MRILTCVSLAFVAACFPDPPSQPPPASGGPDAAISTPMPDAGAAAACVQPATPPGDGHHNAGANCLTCHTGTGAAPQWTAAGTLYADSAGSAPVAGATITLVDGAGKSVTIVTAQNGNFWTSEPLVAPLHPKASRCPSSAAMNGNAAVACNGCHAGSSSPGRIHLQQ